MLNISTERLLNWPFIQTDNLCFHNDFHTDFSFLCYNKIIWFPASHETDSGMRWSLSIEFECEPFASRTITTKSLFRFSTNAEAKTQHKFPLIKNTWYFSLCSNQLHMHERMRGNIGCNCHRNRLNACKFMYETVHKFSKAFRSHAFETFSLK